MVTRDRAEGGPVHSRPSPCQNKNNPKPKKQTERTANQTTNQKTNKQTKQGQEQRQGEKVPSAQFFKIMVCII
jgi:hypothetical protein